MTAAKCCLEKTGQYLFRYSSQDDGQMGKTFLKVLKKMKRSDKLRSQMCKMGVFTGGNSSVFWNIMHASIKTQKLKRSKLINRRGICSEARPAQKPRADLRNQRGASFFSLVSISHTHTQLCRNHGKFVEAPIPDIEEVPVFFSLVNTCHMHTRLCENQGKFIEAPIPDIEEALVFFSLVSTGHMHTKLCGNYG
ncbi:hypothetical protein ACFXTI_016716 [Malus domestica]